MIVALAAVSAAAVHMRLRQAHLRAEMCSLEAERIQLRRKLWDQQLRLGELTAPQHIRLLAEGWPFQVVGPGESSPQQRPARDTRPSQDDLSGLRSAGTEGSFDGHE